MADHVYLVLDPATSTGYCLVRRPFPYNLADIFEYGIIAVNTSHDLQGFHCLDLMRQITDILNKHPVTHIALEDYFFSKKFCSGSNVNAAFRTAIHILACQRGIPYSILNISLWKAFVAGRSMPTKEQKTLWGKSLANKYFIQQALYDRYSFQFPNHWTSAKSQKPIRFKSDIVDAVGQAVYFCSIVSVPFTISKTHPVHPVHPPHITMSVACAPDVLFTRGTIPAFLYGPGIVTALPPVRVQKRNKSPVDIDSRPTKRCCSKGLALATIENPAL
jgi:Holliday junction resolvasome RuvABC endonuclease subunit